jgi:ribosomal protein S18 acetylase RimI-like enzyme
VTRTVVESFSLGDRRIREFAAFPWKLYRGDPCWTPPLMADFGSRLLAMPGLLTREHPYHDHAEVTHFIARRDGEAVGTCSAAINRRFNEYHGTSIGFFGFFESVDDYAVAESLLEAAATWLRERGMDAMRGPGQYSCATHERQGVLVDGFSFPPTVELTHNPPYYAAFCQRYGLAKAKDYVAYETDVGDMRLARLARVAGAVRARRPEITTRAAVMKHLAAEVDLISGIYNEAWAANWGFLPITLGEAKMLANSLAFVADPNLVRFACVDGEPVAVVGAIPDMHVALRPRWRWYGDPEWLRLLRLIRTRRRIERVRIVFFGIRPTFRRLGIEALLLDELMAYLRKRYTWCEASMVLENNELALRICAMMGGHEYKRWRIYEMPL